MSVASEGSPCASLSVKARGMAGSPGCVGSGVCGAITSALCGNIPSWLRKSISVCHPMGTTSVRSPSRNPLKFRAPFSPVSPAINSKRTVLAAESKVSQVGSTRCCWALAGTASERVTNAIPSLDIVPHPLIELRLSSSSACRSSALPISPPRPGRMYSALVEDLRDAREGLTGRVGDVAPAVGSRPAHPVVERLSAWPERLPHNDPTHHPHGFVGHAVVVIDPGHGERDFEVVARMHEEPRVPGLGPLRNSQRMIVVVRVVGGRRVYVLPHDPAHRRTRFHVEPNRIEPYPGADRVASHLDHLECARRTEPRSEERGYGRAPVWHEPEADERQPAGFQELAT